MKDLSTYTTQEIIDELIKRESMDPDFYIVDENVTSIHLKFFKHN